ncbi:HNH endonuclease [Candidatus Poribacteria bacterium]|nr:HNH endonuclease [Candidatus Poribacteria bacterium]
MSKQPPNLPQCNPQTRNFPAAWKESYFRRHYNDNRGGYVCPDCKQVFSGPAGFRQLDADHMTPYSQGGLTVWENLTLRCKPCNTAKGDKL